MPNEPNNTAVHGEAIGRLCVTGDWACANGDLRALRDIARQLAVYVPEPIHCELDGLAAACAASPDHAVALWDALKNRLYRELQV